MFTGFFTKSHINHDKGNNKQGRGNLSLSDDMIEIHSLFALSSVIRAKYKNSIASKISRVKEIRSPVKVIAANHTTTKFEAIADETFKNVFGLILNENSIYRNCNRKILL